MKHFLNHGFHELTRMGKQKNHGVYSLREWSGVFANPLTSELADVFSKTPPSRQAGLAPCFFRMPILGNSQSAKQQGRSRSERTMRLHNPAQARL